MYGRRVKFEKNLEKEINWVAVNIVF